MIDITTITIEINSKAPSNGFILNSQEINNIDPFVGLYMWVKSHID